MNNNSLKKKERRKVLYALTMITQIGLSMMVPLFVCVAMALFIQNRTGAMICVPIGILLGVIVSFRNVYILTQKMYQKDMEKENRELEYFANLAKEREKKGIGVSKSDRR